MGPLLSNPGMMVPPLLMVALPLPVLAATAALTAALALSAATAAAFSPAGTLAASSSAPTLGLGRWIALAAGALASAALSALSVRAASVSSGHIDHLLLLDFPETSASGSFFSVRYSLLRIRPCRPRRRPPPRRRMA